MDYVSDLLVAGTFAAAGPSPKQSLRRRDEEPLFDLRLRDWAPRGVLRGRRSVRYFDCVFSMVFIGLH